MVYVLYLCLKDTGLELLNAKRMKYSQECCRIKTVGGAVILDSESIARYNCRIKLQPHIEGTLPKLAIMNNIKANCIAKEVMRYARFPKKIWILLIGKLYLLNILRKQKRTQSLV